ncbi:MAG TPA: hypothetical protein VGL50_04040 [Steroidobacteraceae bacterium]|jgi:hypothetical protein
MFWVLLSLIFCWLILREFRSTITAPPDMPLAQSVWKPYICILAVLALVCIWQPIHTWLFQRQMSAIATELAEGHVARVHCNTVIDTMFDPDSTNIGHASWQTGVIAFQYPWCNRLMAYIRHPQRADREELESLGLLTHESMHVRGEHNEARTECQAVQRNYRTAKMLGIPDRIAKRNALDYYHSIYMTRSYSEAHDPYFSDQCAPGGELDERLADSSWASHY